MHSQDIQAKYEKHVLFQDNDWDGESALVGKTVVLLFIVNDKTTQWSDSDRQKFLATHQSAMEALMDAAKKHSVSVTIDTVVEEVTIPVACGHVPDSQWKTWILEKHDIKFFKGYKFHYRQNLGYAQIATAFAFNRSFRAYAMPSGKYRLHDVECSVLSSGDRQGTIIHELFHQFGAPDLYYPEAVVESVRKHNYASIMHRSASLHIDPLTAYIIGWSDEIDEKTVALLEDTKHVTSKDVIKALDEIWENLDRK